MPFDKTDVLRKLRRLNWTGGLTKEEMMLSLGPANQQLDEELYYHLPANKKFHSPQEVVESLPKSVWTGIGNSQHGPKEGSGLKVAPDKAARGKTSLEAQKERTREEDLDEVEK